MPARGAGRSLGGDRGTAEDAQRTEIVASPGDARKQPDIGRARSAMWSLGPDSDAAWLRDLRGACPEIEREVGYEIARARQ